MSILTGAIGLGRGAIWRLGAAALVAAGVTSGAAQAAPVSLTGWTADTFSNQANFWLIAAGGASATYTGNGYPSVLTGGGDVLGSQISFDITVTNAYGTDDDFFGFVLGFDPGGVTGTASSDYLLIDWKRGSQIVGAGQALRGLALSQVGDPVISNEYWTHSGGVDELARAATLGSTGWAVGATYGFDVTYTADRVKVWVNDVLQFDLGGSFSSGTFGFYNNSQQGIRYSALDIEALPAVPLPASLPLLLAGVGGLGLIRRMRRKAA
ncbi:MAG: VPLPA-CTERM sorting domain-containing protein [Sphingomonadales bacterium]|nr:VPLPA-CTERM sorting domain-containing protein [Sphingomonadales bacterium]